MTDPFRTINNFKILNRSFLIIVFFVLEHEVIIAQNLVSNYSFEDTPCTGSQDEQEYIYNTPHWSSPNGKTTDIYHSCKTFSWLKTPFPPLGEQVPSHGEGYAGIRLFLDPNTPNSSGQHNYREYLATKLNSSLEKDKTYWISFKFSVAEIASLTTDDLGIYISRDPIPNQDVLSVQPQIRNPEGNILTNTSEWGTISGNYTAQGGEEYIVIGNFNDDANTTMVPKPYVHPFNPHTSYFYIDEVVVEFCETAFPYKAIPSDTLLCDTEQLLIDVEIPNGEYLWNNQSTDSWIKVNTPGLYSVRITSGNCSKVDSINVRFKSPISVNLGTDSLICNVSSILLDATVQNGSYKWSNNSTNATLLVDRPGTYSVKVTVDDCSVVKEINIEQGNCLFFVPNIITPNDDGKNDVFIIESDFRITNRFWLIIYNRWGEKVYESHNYDNDWNGDGLSDGVYFYKCQNVVSGAVVRGGVTIVR